MGERAGPRAGDREQAVEILRCVTPSVTVQPIVSAMRRGFNPQSSVPDFGIRERVDLSTEQKEKCNLWIDELHALGIVSEVDVFFFKRDVDTGFLSSRERGRLWVKARRAGVNLDLDLDEPAE